MDIGTRQATRTGVPVAGDRVKPGEITTSVADDGVRRALREWMPQAKTVLVQAHQEAAAWFA
jgi:hypothetical protein